MRDDGKILVVNESCCMWCGYPTGVCTCKKSVANAAPNQKEVTEMSRVIANHPGYGQLDPYQQELQELYNRAKVEGMTDEWSEDYAQHMARHSPGELVRNEEKIDQSQGLEPLEIDWVENSVFASPCGECPDKAEGPNPDHLVPLEIDWTANSIFASKE